MTKIIRIRIEHFLINSDGIEIVPEIAATLVIDKNKPTYVQSTVKFAEDLVSGIILSDASADTLARTLLQDGDLLGDDVRFMTKEEVEEYLENNEEHDDDF